MDALVRISDEVTFEQSPEGKEGCHVVICWRRMLQTEEILSLCIL